MGLLYRTSYTCYQENSNVCFELMPEAKRILQKVQEDYGTVEAFMAQLYGDQKIPAEDPEK